MVKSVNNVDLHMTAEQIAEWLSEPVSYSSTLESLPHETFHEIMQIFNRSGMGKTTYYQFLKATALEIGVPNHDIHSHVVLAPTKDLGRLAQKTQVEKRHSNDANRGRILLQNSLNYSQLISLLNGQTGSRAFYDEWKNKSHPVSFVRNDQGKIAFDNYIFKKRKSGYCLSINFDVVVKSANAPDSTYEIQAMPFGTDKTYDQSHLIYDRIIRRLDTELKNPDSHSRLAEAQKVHDLFVKINNIMCRDALRDANLIHLNTDSEPRLSPEEHYWTSALLAAIFDHVRAKLACKPNNSSKKLVLETLNQCSSTLDRHFYRHNIGEPYRGPDIES